MAGSLTDQEKQTVKEKLSARVRELTSMTCKLIVTDNRWSQE